jgi:hypothetical protein
MFKHTVKDLSHSLLLYVFLCKYNLSNAVQGVSWARGHHTFVRFLSDTDYLISGKM